MVNDVLLIWRFKCGSKEAFEAIYDKYADGMVTLAKSLLGDKNKAEDVVQDVFVSFAENIDKLKIRRSLKSYLLTSAANRVRDLFRRSGREIIDGDAIGAAVVEKTAEQQAMQAEEIGMLRSAIVELPYEQREAVILRAKGGVTFRAIAELQNVSIKTAISRYRYGIDKLRSMLNYEVKK